MEPERRCYRSATSPSSQEGDMEPRSEAGRVVDTTCDCRDCVARSTETYDLPGGCHNCGATFNVRARKGDKPPLGVRCPSCEVTEYLWRRLRIIEEARRG